MDKFDRHFAEFPFHQLITQAWNHKTEKYKLDKEWYDHLLIHLQERELEEVERKLLDYVVKSEPFLLKLEENKFQNLLEEVIELHELKKSNRKINADYIVEAGRSIKTIFYTICITILTSILFVFFIATHEPGPIGLVVFGFLGLISTIIILAELWKVGDCLQKSISQK